MWLSVDIHSRPSVSDDLDVCSMDVLVSLDEVSSEDGGIEFGRSDWGLFGFDVDGVLDGVGGDDDAVVGSGVARGC